MPINYPGPYEVEYIYRTPISGVTLPHYLRVNCVALSNPAPGTLMSAIQFQTIGGTPVNAETAIATFWGWFRQQLSNTVTCDGATLFKYETGTFAKTFIAAYAGTPLAAGASVQGSGAAHQYTQTYRTAGGSILKLTWLEDINSTLNNVANLVANGTGSNDQKLAAYMISSAGWIIGRDDTYPVAPYRSVFGQNEAVYKQRFR